MFKKLLVATFLSFISVVSQAAPLTVPLSFNDMVSSIAVRESIEILFPKNYPKERLTMYNSPEHQNVEIIDKPEGLLVKLKLTDKRWSRFSIDGDPSKTIPTVDFLYGNGMIYKVVNTYYFGHESRELAMAKKDTVEKQIFDNLKAAGYSRFLFLGVHSNSSGVTVDFKHLDYMQTHNLYVTIAQDDVTALQQAIEKSLLLDNLSNERAAVDSMFKKE